MEIIRSGITRYQEGAGKSPFSPHPRRIMRIKNLHPWDVSPAEASQIQRDLARRVVHRPLTEVPRYVAGADLAFDRNSNTAYACVVLLAFPSLEIVDRFTLKGRTGFPYIPGYLSFREAPVLLELFRKVRPAPDLILFDGQGIAHPRKLGLASHLGLFLNRPSVGCAKTRLIGSYTDPGNRKGSVSPLLDKNGDTLGSVVRTREGCKPVYVSVGHQIDLDSAVEWTLRCTTRYRIPEPTRQADILAGEFKKSDRL